MNHQQIREELSKAEQTQKAASERIARLTKLLNEPQGCWKPKEGFSCYIAYGDGSIGCETYNIERYGVIGHAFPTRAAAELHVKRLKVIQKLRELAGGFKPDFREDGVEFYRVSYDRGKKKWGARRSFYYSQIGDIPFATLETAQAAITTLGDELNCLIEGV